MAGVVTGGAALAALGVIGEILAAVGVIVVIFGVIEGAIERSVRDFKLSLTSLCLISYVILV